MQACCRKAGCRWTRCGRRPSLCIDHSRKGDRSVRRQVRVGAQGVQRDDRPAAGLDATVADVADVISCVGFARDHAMPLAIRAGGHSAPGFGIVRRRPGRRTCPP